MADPCQKSCTKCGAVKSLDKFPLSKRNTDGFHSWCRKCLSAYCSAANRKRRDAALRNKPLTAAGRATMALFNQPVLAKEMP